jgi:hypothetical protein
MTPSRTLRTIAGLMLALSLVGGAPRTVHAGGLPVIDFSDIAFDIVGSVEQLASTILQGEDFMKEYVLDPIAWLAKSAALQSMAQSMLNWTASGFDGSPSFVTNLRDHLRGVGDQVADGFLEELTMSGTINSPFREHMVSQLRGSYRRMTSDRAFFEENRYTLDQYSSNPEAFISGDFSEGGIRAWIGAWTNCQNNPLCARTAAEAELNQRITTAQSTRTRELDWGRGYFSWCGNSAAPVSSETTSLSESVASPADCDIRTPGTTFADMNPQVLGIPINTLITADEIDEVLMGVLGNLLNDALSEGLSERESGPGGHVSEPVSEGFAAAFVRTVEAQRIRIEQYRSSWAKIKSAADTAVASCTRRGAVAQVRATATEMVGRGAAALNKATTAKTALDEIVRKAQAATTLEDSKRVSDEYAALTTPGSSVLPSANEIIEAITESQETTGDVTPSYFTKMTTITNSGCRRSE